MEKTEPKYKVGQIVVVKSVKKELPFRILSIKWDDGWYYQWNRNNYASEGMLRELTLAEFGYRPRPKLTLITDEEIIHQYNVGWLPHKAEALTEDDLRRLRGRAVARAQLDHNLREG